MRPINSYLRQAMTDHGVRRIPTNVRSLTGDVLGHEFESSLERDALLLVHWDHQVDWYRTQPLTIDFVDENGGQRKYTPDLLISYRKETVRRPTLCEIKYRADLAKNWRLLKRKFLAARRYAEQQNWDFLLICVEN